MSAPKLITLVLAAFAVSATSALAGSWPEIPKRKMASAPAECCAMKEAKAANTATAAPAIVAADGFEFIGGEAGWQPAVHKFVLTDGHVAHAADCPIALAAVTPRAPADGTAPVETSPGA